MKSSTPSILILTGSFGHGHNTAARNLKAAFHQYFGDEARVEVVDFFLDHFPTITGVLQKGYGFAINQTPAIWKRLYRLADTDRRPVATRFFRGKFRVFLERKNPDIILSTFPLFPCLIADLYPDPNKRPFRFHTVITDAITINALWCQGHSDHFFVTDAWSKAIVLECIGKKASVFDHGFPLTLPEAPAVALGCPSRHPARVLYIPTTTREHVSATCETLSAWCHSHDARLTVVLGKHEARLKNCVQGALRALSDSRCEVHGWRDDVPRLMREHHVVVTKAGGATVSEALGALCPPILNYVVPGQEEGNLELVLKSRCGAHIDDPRRLPEMLSEIFHADGAATWQRFRRQLTDLDRAAASPKIVQTVLEDHRANSRQGEVF